MDIAQWAMGQELGGPLTVESHAKFYRNDLVTVHGAYQVEMSYPKNVKLLLNNKLKRKLTWDVVTESFVGDDAANALRNRKARKPEYNFELALKRAGLA